MSGRRSKKNQKLGSSRRGARGLRVPEEKDNDECDNGQNEIHTTTDPTDNQSTGTALQAQSHQTTHQTSALDCSPHAGAQIHKDSDMEAELPERKRKIGSTRKKTDGFTNVRKFEIHDEMGTTEEFGEEQVTQTNTSVIKEEHISFTEDEQSNLHEHSTSLNVSSDLSRQFGGELGVAQNIMVTVSQSKEHNAIDHQEIASDSQNVESDMSNDVAMRQSADSIDQEIQQASTSGHKRKMGSTRKPLAGNRGKNLEGREPLRNTPGDIWEAEVKSSSEPEFNMLEEMMQTWDDVKRKDSPTNTSSHTESEKAEELNVSSETETNIRSVAYSVFDPTQQLFEKHHEAPLLNKEFIFKLGSDTNNMIITSSPSTPTNNHAPNTEIDDLIDNHQDVPDSRRDTNTSEDCRSVTLAETKEEQCRNDSKIILSSKQEDVLLVSYEKPLSSPCHLDGATKDEHYEISTDAQDNRSSEMLNFDISHFVSRSEMTKTGPDFQSLEDEEKKTLEQSRKMEEDATQRMEHKEESLHIQAIEEFTEQGFEKQSEVQNGKTRISVDEEHSANETLGNLSDSSLYANYNLPNVLPVINLDSLLPGDCKPSCDVMTETAVCSQLKINNEVSAVSFPEADDVAESREIYVEKDTDDVSETLITCHVAVTEIVMDVKDFTEPGVDLQTLENESVGSKTESETDAFQMIDQDDVKDYHNMTQIFINARDKEEGESFIQCMSEENAEVEVLLKAKCPAFDRENETGEKYKVMEDFEESRQHEMSSSLVAISDVTEPLANTQDNDIKSDLQTEKISSDNNLEAFHVSENANNISGVTDSGLVLRDTVTESSLDSISERTEINIISQDFQEEDLNQIVHKQKISISVEKDAGPVKVLDSALMTSSSEKSKAESICNTTESQNLTKNITVNDEDTKSEEIFTLENINSEVTVTSLIHQQLFIQTTDEDVHDIIQKGKDTYKASEEETFLSANTEHTTVNRRNETKDTQLDSQSDLQTINPIQNRVLTEEENDKSSDMNLEQTLRGNTGQRKHKEFHDDSDTFNIETLINEEKEDEREIRIEKDADPVEVLDSEESTAESICDITASQNLTKSHAEFKENSGDVENAPVEGDTKPHLEIQSEIEMFDSKIVERGKVENVCEVDVLMKQVEIVGDKNTVDSNMTIETDFLQNNTSTDTNQETLKASENVESTSTVIDSCLVLQDAVPESFPESNAVSEKAEINIIPEDSQGEDSHPSPLVHKRKMGSTRRPLRGNKEKEQDFKKMEEKTDEEDTESDPKIQDQNNVVDYMMQRMMDVKHTEEEETSETVIMTIKECSSENKEWGSEITSSNTSQTKDAPPLVDSVDMETEREVGEENRDGETENITVNDEDTKSEEIFTLENINSEVTVTSLTHQQLFIQTTDEEVYDVIQSGKDMYEESIKEETFLSANTEHTTVNRRNKSEDAQSDSQSDLQTINPIQNRVLTEEENDKSSDMNLEQTELQQTEHAENVSAVTDSGVSFEDVVTVDSEESHTVHENISEISEDSQKEEMQSKLNPLVHKRKMGSTRRPLRGNTGQRKHKEFHDDSDTFNIETLINEGKEDEREIRIEKDADPVEVLDSEESTAESICDITESQNLIKSHTESQKNAGDVENAPVEGDTKPHLEIQSEIEMFDSTIVERGKVENVCEVDVLMKQVEFVGDTVTVDSNMTIETDFLQNNTTINTNQEMLKASKSFESVCSVTDTVIESFPESNTIYEKNKISIIPEDSQREDLHPKLSPVVHKRKMGSTRRPLRGNKEKDQDFKEKKEDTEPHSEVQDQNNVVDQNIKIENVMDVGHNEEEENSRTCEHPSENKKCYREITLEQEQRSSPNIFQTQTEPSQHDADQNLPVILESTSEFKDKPLVLSDAMFMEENQVTVPYEPVLIVDSPQTESKEIYSASSRSLPKRKMGSTRKTLRGKKMENKRDFGEEKEGEMDEETTDLKETFTLEEAISLTITGTQVHQTPFRLDPNIEAHDIQDTGNKPDEHTENPEQAKIFVNEQNYPNSYTNQGPSEYADNVTVSSLVTVSEESHKQEIQSKMNPVAQRRKMGSTRKTLKGNNGQSRRETESKNMDGDSESESELKSDENTQFKEPTSFERVVQPETIPKIFSKPEDEVKKVINSQSNEVPLEASTITDLESEMLVCAPDLKVGEKNYLECSEPSGSSEPEKSDKSRSLEVKSDTFQIGDNQLQLTVSDQSHQVLSEKHLQTETVTVEKRKKMGSTRKNFRGKREEKKREESDGTDQIINDNLEQTDDSLLNEIEKELNKSSQSSQNVDYQVMINEPNSGNLSVETSHLNTPENSKPEHESNKDNFTSLQVTKSQRSESPSELSSPGRRRKMGSTRKNPRHQVKGEDDDDDDMGEKNKQGPKVSKKDLETAEESKECDITNKEYLDIPIALTSSCELEENATSVMQESTSPSTKRKFGSRRTNMSRSGLVISKGGNELEKGEHTPDSSEVHQHSDDIMVHDSRLSLQTENQPIMEYRDMETRSKEPVPCAPTKSTDTAATGLVSLDQIIKARQHDRSPGKTQAADLKNISDMEAIQFNVVMVGNSCVGKTSFIRRLHVGQFSLDYCSTIGVDTCVQNVVLDDKVVKLHIWDTAGQERFHSITTQVFHRADSLLLMYEITSSKSFISVRDWITQVQEKAPDDVIMMLLGNKSDCAEREVQVQEGEALAREYKISFMECSAATGENVSECIKSLAELLLQRKNQKMEKYTVLKREQPQKKSGCC